MKASKYLLITAGLVMMLGCGGGDDSSSHDGTDVIQKEVFEKVYSKTDVQTSAALQPVVNLYRGVNGGGYYALSGTVAADQNNVDHRGLDALLVKTDTHGNILWSRAFRYDGNETKIYDVNERFDVLSVTGDGIIAASTVYPNGSATVYNPMIVKVDFDGNKVWGAYYYDQSGNIVSMKINRAVNADAYTYAVGYAVIKLPNNNTQKKGVLLKIDNQTGDVKAYVYDNGEDIVFNSLKYSSGKLYVTGNVVYNYLQMGLLSIMDVAGSQPEEDGAYRYIRKTDDGHYYESSDLQGIEVDGENLYMIYSDKNPGTDYVNPIYIKTSSHGSVQEAWQFGTSTYYSYFTNMYLNNQKLYIGIMNTSAYVVNPQNSEFEKVISGVAGWQDYVFKNENGDAVVLMHDGINSIESKLAKIDTSIETNCTNVYSVQRAHQPFSVIASVEVYDASYGNLSEYVLSKKENIAAEDVNLSQRTVCEVRN